MFILYIQNPASLYCPVEATLAIKDLWHIALPRVYIIEAGLQLIEEGL